MMSKPAFIKFLGAMGCAVAALGLLIGARILLDERNDGVRLPASRAQVFKTAVRIPAGRYSVGSREPGCRPPRMADLSGVYLWPVEVPAAWWHAFRGGEDAPGGSHDLPAVSISYADALAFCRWFSDRYGVTARLPTVEEWEVAARAGRGGVTYGWGWGHPDQAGLRKDGPEAVSGGRPNPWGLYRMSGNVAEWCAAGEEDAAPVLGGSWAERDPKLFRISHRLALPKTYHDRDVGFRIAIEPPAMETVATAARVGE